MKKVGIKQVVEELKKSKIVRSFKPASLAEVEAHERMLAVRFSPVFTEFLTTFGVLEIYERTVFGLGPAIRPHETRSLMFHTLYARSDATVKLPPHLVVIWHDSHSDYQCLDTSQIQRGDCPIVYFDNEIARSRSPKPTHVADGFHDWLRMRVDSELKIKADWDAYVASKKRAPKPRKKT